MKWGINMSSKCKRSLSLVIILTIMFSFIFPYHILIVIAEENEADEEIIEEIDGDIETGEDLDLNDPNTDDGLGLEDDPGFNDGIVDGGLEIEEVEVADREDISDDEVESALSEMQLMAENEHLELYFQATTAEVAVKEKNSGKKWFSNPVDSGTDSVARGENNAILGSQFSIVYFHTLGQVSRMHSSDSVRSGQFEFEPIEGGFKVTYTLGDTSKGVEMIPYQLTPDRFQTAILDKIEDEVERDAMKARFEYFEDEDVYRRRELVFQSNIALEKTLNLLEEIGYTEEDLAADNEAAGLVEEAANKPNFVIPIEYRLDGDNFLVTVVGEDLEENESYPISEIHLLGLFGAANEFKDGYIFIPDGSGALIQLNNEKVNFQPYLEKVYGYDNALHVRERREVSQDIKLPIFGLKQDDQAFLAIIEQGDAIAHIGADVAGRVNSYNSVNARFRLRERARVTLTGGEQSTNITMFQEEGYRENLSIRYAFLVDDQADYSGMASYYRDYLIEKGALTQLEPADATPFYLELVGSILKRKTFLGIPYQSVEDVTTFSEAEEIVSALYDAGVQNIKLRYSGWFNGSAKHKIPKKVKVDSAIGGKKGLEEFNEFLQEKDINLYPDVAFLNVERKSLGFSPIREASRRVDRQSAIQYPFSPSSFRRDMSKIPSYVLSPRKLSGVVEGFADDYADLNIGGLSLRDMGNELNSDYREKDVVNREQAKVIVQEQLGELENQFSDLLVEGGNAVALPYADHVVYAPSDSSQFNITDQSIPFYQMVIHGYIDYAAAPVNISPDQDINHHLLKALETGANIHFKWMYADSSVVKETEFDDLFSGNYQIWFDQAVEMYHEVNEALNEVRTEKIIAHEELSDGVFKTTYSNDKSFIVNYNNESVQVDDTTVEARGYAIREGGLTNVSKR